MGSVARPHEKSRGARKRLVQWTIAVLGVLTLAACEKPFEPLAPSDLSFSIYGHLDAAADTQWVRIMPIRASLQTHPEPIDAVVTLEELETGAMVQMSDELVRYLPVILTDAETYAHNFSTTMPMVPGRHYRLTATRSDGAEATATVIIPVFENPTMVVTNRFACPGCTWSSELGLTRGVIRGTHYLGMILGRQDVPQTCDWPIRVHQEFLPITSSAAFDGDDHGAQLSWGFQRPSYVPSPPPVEICEELGPKRVLAIASGDPWPYSPTAALRELTHPASINNIEGGIGFLVGVQTHVFPFGRCVPLERTGTCTITFDPQSATLVGLVTGECTGGPLPDIRVRLLGPPTNGIRDFITNDSGTFEFHGLEPGAPHSLELTTLLPFGDFLPLEIENVVVTEAAVDTVSLEMAHRRNCAA